MKDLKISDIKVLWNSDEIDSAVKKLSKKIIKQFKDFDSINLIPILTGGLVFASKLLIGLESLKPGSSRMFPLIAKTYGNSLESQGTKIYGYEFLADSLERNSPSIIVDDLMDTGETLQTVRENVLAISNEKIYTAVLVDKLGNRNNIFHPDFTCFVLDDDKWIVGYGMDYIGKFRGLDYVGSITKDLNNENS